LTNDVAPVILKNIRISYNSKELHHWILDKHGENVVRDELKNMPAIASTPYWTMDNRIYWEKVAEFKTSSFPQITFDSIRRQIYILDADELIAYSLLTHSAQRMKCSPEAQGKFYNHLLFDPISSRLFYYSIEKKKNYYYDFAENSWIDYQHDDDEATHAHQNRYISNYNSFLYLFGGYGFYKYKSDFFKIDLKTNEWVRYDFSHTITPRYLAAMGGNSAGDKVYILGGRGAEMGRQELSPKNFSDLFEVDLKTVKVKYLFDTDKDDNKENIYSNSLIVDENDKNLYVLAYPNKTYASSIRLKKINLEKQTTETLANAIEFYFQDATSFCDLYYSKQLSKLIAVAAYSNDQKTFSIHIYTLDYPPLTEQDVIQFRAGGPNKWWFFITSTLLFAIVAWIVARKMRKQPKKARNKNKAKPETEKGKEREGNEKAWYNFRKKAILFIGGFQVFNKNGDNITGDFTPTLKHILVLIILYSLKNNKGISSSKLQEFLWFDKTEEAARNNRNVNISKLRVILQDLGNIDISNQNGYWTISLPEDVLSDYKETFRLADKIQKEAITSKEDLQRLLVLLDYGQLLPNIQLEWVDNFKTDFTNIVIDTLMYIVNNTNNPFYDNQEIRLRIADSLLKLDSINEEALVIKCKAFVKMGKKSLAKATFDNFSREYKTLLGEPYAGVVKSFLA
jgi:DNA-binding SARP family transcriptional activator